MYECNECKKQFKAEGTPTECPHCGSAGVQVLPQKTLSEENQRLEQQRAAETRRSQSAQPSPRGPSTAEKGEGYKRQYGGGESGT